MVNLGWFGVLDLNGSIPQLFGRDHSRRKVCSMGRTRSSVVAAEDGAQDYYVC